MMIMMVIVNNHHTFYGVLSTILNLSAGIIKSYYKYVPSCEYIQDSLLR
jgi:hypothetical protein